MKHVRRLRWALGLVGVVVVALLGYTGYQALQAKDALELVALEFEEIADDLKVGDEDAARSSLRSAQDAAQEARDNTRGPGWWLTSRLPEVGDDVEAVRTVADVTLVLSDEVLPEVVVASDKLDPANLRPHGGRIAIRPLVDAADELVAADERMQRQEGRVAAIDVSELNAQLRQPVELMQTKLAEAASLSSKASYALRLLPSMLGADEERTYLVLFQNNAEVRATGGIPGAWATMTARDGHITLGEQGSAGDIGRLEAPPLDLTEEELGLYGDRLGLFPQNLTFTPDFPRTAELAQAMWEQETDLDVDGVFSVDPVALSYLLEGTGPVELPGGRQLTGDNAVRLLLNEIYRLMPDPRSQDAFFAAAAAAVFDKVASGAGDATQVLAALDRAGTEGRLFVWSERPEEQSLLEETALGGAVPPEGDDDRPFLGVFLNDATGAKMQYFLDHRVDVTSEACNSEGRQRLTVTLTMESTAPEQTSALPSYVVGLAEALGIEPGSMRVNAHLYVPVGGWIEESSFNGAEMPLTEDQHVGHTVGTQTVQLAPGERHSLTYSVMTGREQTEDVRLRVTPGIRTAGAGQVSASACNAG